MTVYPKLPTLAFCAHFLLAFRDHSVLGITNLIALFRSCVSFTFTVYFKNVFVKDPHLFYVTICLSFEKLQKYHEDTLICIIVEINEAYPICSLYAKCFSMRTSPSLLPPTMRKDWQSIYFSCSDFVAWPYTYWYLLCGGITSKSGF